MGKRKPTAPIERPIYTAADLDTYRAMNLTVMSYQNRAIPVYDEQSHWLPQHLMGADLALVLWCPAGTGNYNIDGWQPQLGPFTHGGRYPCLASALAWVQRARDVRDGKHSDFRGV